MPSSSKVFHQAVGHSAYSALGTVSVFIVNFLFAGLTIRYLGNDQAGFFIVLSSIFALSQVAGGLGLTTPATKRATELFATGEVATVRRLIGSVLLINSLIGVSVVVGCLVFFPTIFGWSRLAESIRSDAFAATMLMAGSFFADQAAGSLRLLYAACLRQDLKNYTMSAMGLLGGVVRIVWLAFCPTMPAAAAAAFAVSAAWLILDAWLVRRLLGRAIWPDWCRSEIKPLLGFSLWELFNSAGICAGNTMDRFILTSYMGSGSLPFYAIAQRFFQQIHAALAQQFSFVFPLLVAAGSDVQANISLIQDRARWFIATLGALVYASLFLAGPTVVALLISPEFAERARWPVYLVSIQGLAFSFVITNYFLHYSLGNGAINALFNVGNYILAIGLALWLIPRYSYLGASIAQISVVLATFVFLRSSRKVLGVEATGMMYWSAYASPLVLFFVAAGVGRGIEIGCGPSIASATLAVVAGISAGLFSLYVLERTIFRSYHRVQMVQAAWDVIMRRVGARRAAVLP